MVEYTADVLTEMAEKWLRKQYPDAIIMREFNAAKWGGALIDVVALTKTQIIGIEIKGHGDTLTRLKLQGPAYSMIASSMYLLCCPELAEKLKKKSLKPFRWMNLIIKDDGICFEHEWLKDKFADEESKDDGPPCFRFFGVSGEPSEYSKTEQRCSKEPRDDQPTRAQRDSIK